jgi:hypothetical protein
MEYIGSFPIQMPCDSLTPVEIVQVLVCVETRVEVKEFQMLEGLAVIRIMPSLLEAREIVLGCWRRL